MTAGAAPRNLLGVHAGLWVADWSPESARFAIAGSAAAGFDLIEIPVVNPRTTDLQHTSSVLAEHSLTSVVSLALDRHSDINTEDPELSARGERRLMDAVRFARDTGSTYIGGVVYGAMMKYDHAGSPAARENSLTVLRRVADAAAASGITLGMEYVHRYESNLLNTAAQTVQFIQDLGAPNVVLHIDTFHVNMEEVSQAAAVRDAGPLLGYIHAAENHRGELGRGSIDWLGLFAELHHAGYSGPSRSSPSHVPSWPARPPMTSACGASCGTTRRSWPARRARSCAPAWPKRPP